MSNPILAFENLKKQFGYHRAVKCASGTLHESDCVSLFGINGAGKSTLLYLLSGVYNPDGGKIHYPSSDKKSFHRKMQLMSHQSMFYARLSAQENLSFFQSLYERVNNDEILFALEFTGLLDSRKNFIDGFSRGMIQRLMIARMILAKPEFVFFDEPFTGLDIRGQKILMAIIRNKGIPELHWHIKSYIFVDHDIERAYDLSSTIWYIQNGTLQEPMNKDQISLVQLREILA